MKVWSKATWLLLQLRTELGIILVILVLQACRMKSYGIMKLPPKFQRQTWEHRQCVAGSGFLQAASVKALHKAVRVKPRL
jgi:hypothetical protein